MVREDSIIIVKWLDNNVVCAASTIYGVNPISHVERYSQNENINMQITDTNVIGEYNRFMGSIDRLDENVSTYSYILGNKTDVI